MQVRDVMTNWAECVLPADSLQEAARKMRDLNIGPLPVRGDDDRLVGILTDRDITVRAVAEGCDPRATAVQNVMTRDVVFCFKDQDVQEAARLMQQYQVRRLVVLNQDERIVGIVSLGDLAVETEDQKLAGKTLKQVCLPL